MAYKVKQEELLDLLPTNIANAEELSIQAKKILGALHHWILYSQAQETGRIIIGNKGLATIAGVSKDDNRFNEYLGELLKYGLVTRKTGKRRTLGEKNQASEYFINWEALEQPLVKIDYNQRFSAFRQKSGCIDKNSIDKYSIDKYRKVEYIKDNISIDNNRKVEINIDNISKENNIKENGTTLNNIFTEKIEEDNNKKMEHINDNIKEEKSSIFENNKEEEIKAKLDNIYTKLFTEEVPFENNINNTPIEENVPLEKPLIEEKKETNQTRKHSIEETIDCFVYYFNDKYLSHVSCWQELQHQQEVALGFLRSWDENHPKFWDKHGFSKEEANEIVNQTRLRLIANIKERIESMKAATPSNESVYGVLPF